MKKAITKIKANIAVDTKIVLAVMMASTAALGLSFAAATFQLPTDRLDRTIKVTKPNPMFTPSISEARVNVGFTELDSDVQAGLHASQINANFVMDGVELGSLELIDNFFTPGSTYEGNRVSPLALYYTTYNEMADISYLPNHILRVTRGDYNYTLCVPETVVYDSNTNISNTNVVYYFDNSGTAYFDKNLSQAALPKSCPQLLANALTINEIPNAYVNFPILWGSGWGSGGPQDSRAVPAYFMRDGRSLAVSDLNRVSFDSYGVTNTGRDPLAISISNDVDNYNWPNLESRVLYIFNNSLTETLHELCIPEMEIAEWSRSTFFFDKYGTPYFDSLLTRPVLDKSCSQILANSLIADNPVFAQTSVTTDIEMYASFLRNMGSNGDLNLATNQFISNYPNGWSTSSVSFGDWGYNSVSPTIDDWGMDPVPEPVTHSPFMMLVTHNENTAHLLPNSNIVVAVSTSTGEAYQLCAPQTNVPSINSFYEGDSKLVKYFYDNQGKPYRDVLLQEPVTCPAVTSYRVCDFNNDGVRDAADQAIFDNCEWFDTNGDGVSNLLDLAEYGQNWNDDVWCQDNMWTCAWGYQN